MFIQFPLNLSARCLCTFQSTRNGCCKTLECSLPLRLWCLVRSSGNAGLTYVLLRMMGEILSGCKNGYWDPNSVFQCVVLSFSRARSPMQTPATARSILDSTDSVSRTSILSTHGMPLHDIDLSNPHAVKLETKRNLSKLEISTTFLCTHYCAFWQIWAKCQIICQNTLSALTLNDRHH